MYNEVRYIYYKDDKFEPKVEMSQTFGPDVAPMVKLDITSFISNGEKYIGQQVVMKFDVDHAKLLVQKLQEGIDKHENETGN